METQSSRLSFANNFVNGLQSLSLTNIKREANVLVVNNLLTHYNLFSGLKLFKITQPYI